MQDLVKHCRKCLVEGMDKGEYLQWLQNHIDNLDEQKRVTQEEYHSRLAICQQCERLNDGMCSACGCFVIFRCIGRVQVCSYGKW